MSVDWLKANLGSEGLVVLDSTWFLPRLERSGKDEFLGSRIEGALFFDYDAGEGAFDEKADFPRMMPSVDRFEGYVRGLGVCKGSQVVVYDNNDMFSSPRAWWMFKAMGLDEVAVLDGGLKAWIEAGYKTVGSEVECLDEIMKDVAEGDFVGRKVERVFIGSEDVLDDLKNDDVTVIDARAGSRYEEAHMPEALNLHYEEVLMDGKMKNLAELKGLYQSQVDMKGGEANNQALTFSCGSGVTACVLALGATLCGYEKVSVYDASWSEWGKGEQFPKVSS